MCVFCASRSSTDLPTTRVSSSGDLNSTFPSPPTTQHQTYLTPHSLLSLSFFFFWPHCTACALFVSRPGIEPRPSAVRARSLKRWMRLSPWSPSHMSSVSHNSRDSLSFVQRTFVACLASVSAEMSPLHMPLSSEFCYSHTLSPVTGVWEREASSLNLSLSPFSFSPEFDLRETETAVKTFEALKVMHSLDQSMCQGNPKPWAS